MNDCSIKITDCSINLKRWRGLAPSKIEVGGFSPLSFPPSHPYCTMPMCTDTDGRGLTPTSDMYDDINISTTILELDFISCIFLKGTFYNYWYWGGVPSKSKVDPLPLIEKGTKAVVRISTVIGPVSTLPASITIPAVNT